MKNKIKVLHISKYYYPFIGGIERFIQNVVNGLDSRVSFRILVCNDKLRGGKRKIGKIPVIKAGILRIILSMPISLSFPFLLWKEARKADILHFHLPFPLASICYQLFGPRDKKIVVSYHSDIIRQKKAFKIYKPFLLRFLHRADKIIVSSENLINSSEILNKYRNKCIIIPYFIDPEFEGGWKKFDFGVKNNEKFILFVGRLIYYKGLEYLIEAMKDVYAKLVVVGIGSLEKKLKQLVKNKKLENKIIFLGKVSDSNLKYLYKKAGVFVLPSVERAEAFGIVQLEAMAYGKPIVNTNLGTGVNFVSVDGRTGITVPPRNSKALAGAINKILTNKRLAYKFSREARKRIKLFSREEYLNKIYSIYLDLIK